MTDNISFEHAPLIEIVAELRWLPRGVEPPIPGQTNITIGGMDADTFLLAFGRQPDIGNFTTAEKLVPSGMPTIWHQIVWRFRDPNTKGVLLQVGAGVFTANGVQPYERWSDFRPTVVSGVKALLASRTEEEKDLPLIGLSLRYINAFSAVHMEGVSPPTFMRDVLNFKVDLPAALKALHVDGEIVNTSTNILIPIANTSKKMNVQVGDGAIRQIEAANDSPAVMLDMTVFESAPIEPNLDAVMGSLDESRDVIHNAFLTMTEGIRERMKPIQGGVDVAT